MKRMAVFGLHSLGAAVVPHSSQDRQQHLQLPSQSASRGIQQTWVCVLFPGHMAPPFWGAGLLHCLLLSCEPALHSDQELQQLQRPSALAPAG